MTYLSDELLAPLRPEETSGREATLFEVLESTPVDLGGHFQDDPLAAAMVHEAMGRSYQSIGRATEALASFQRALDLRESLRQRKRAGTEKVARRPVRC